MKSEKWKAIPGTGGAYEASSLGLIRRAQPGKATCVGRTLSQTLDPTRNYWRVTVPRRFGVSSLVHVLVATAFLGVRPKAHEVNHKNGIGTDNRLSNLEWVTRAKNCKHAFEHGLRPRLKGTSNGFCRLTEQQVRNIRSRYESGETQVSLARAFKISQPHVSEIVRRVQWSHI